MTTDPETSTAVRGRALRETATAVGVVLGLVFVGVEIRTNTTAVQGATLHGISDQSLNLQISIATDEHLVRLMPQIIRDGAIPDDFGVEDQYRAMLTFRSLLKVSENRFRQARLGTVPEGGVEQFGTRSLLYATPYFRAIWPIVRGSISGDFARFLTEEYGLPMDEIDRGSMNGGTHTPPNSRRWCMAPDLDASS